MATRTPKLSAEIIIPHAHLSGLTTQQLVEEIKEIYDGSLPQETSWAPRSLARLSHKCWPSHADGRALRKARLFCEIGTGDARQGGAGDDGLRREGLLGERLPPSPRGPWMVIWKVALFLVLMGTVAGCPSYGGRPAPTPPTNQTLTEMPQFSWPPPKPSAFASIPRSLLVKDKTQAKVGNVADRLEEAFSRAGYGERTWYSVPGPGGFALASRLEQFYPDGTPRDEADRWSAQIKAPAIFGLRDVVRALFTPQKGHYRVIVFIVTSQPFSAADEAVSPKRAMKWVQGGAFNLPDAIRNVDYTAGHYCVAFIYQFEQLTRDNQAVFKSHSELEGETHLRKARIWSAWEVNRARSRKSNLHGCFPEAPSHCVVYRCGILISSAFAANHNRNVRG